MKDISDVPNGTEQAKPTEQNKPRNNARSKPENQGTGSQDQETKSAPRRRPAHTADASSDQGQTQQHTPQQQSEGHQTTHRPHPGNRGGAQGGNRPYNPSQGGGNRPFNGPSQGQGGNRPYNPSQGGGNRPFNGPSQGGNRPYNPSQGGGNRSFNGPSQGQGGNRPYNPSQGGGNRSFGGPPQGGGNRSFGGPPQGGNRSFGGPPVGAPAPVAPERPARGSRNQRGSSQDKEKQQRTYNERPMNAPAPKPGNRTNSRSNNNTRTQERRTAPVKEKVTGPISLPPQIVVKDLADMLSVSPIEVIRDLINKHAIFASINQVVDYDKASLVAKDLGFEPSLATAEAVQKTDRLSANEAMIASRDDDGTVIIPPVVTIMGHVDHGKTSLLDTIRKTKVADGEAGGITQHIGAYQVEVDGKKITFLDTPGHEAFTAMRARGAQVTHIAIIVVAADDGVMPQTREAIDHARAAKVPIIIALNKIDKANANPDRVKQQLVDMGIMIEEYGGDTVCVPMSAKRGIGIDELLEYIILVAEVQDIRANPNRAATGVIIEAKMEKNSGVTATVLVQQGTLKMGDNIVVGAIAGKVRAMFNDRGKRIQKAPPSTPVSILGLSEIPQAGDQLEVTPDERTAKVRAQQESERLRNETGPLGQVSLDTLYMQMQEGTVKELNVVIKSDVQGSLEAIKGSLSKLGEENLKVRLIHEGVGNISEADVHLASASGAIIIGFNVKADGAAQREASREGVDIRYYEVIYKLIEDIEAALTGMLEPTYREVIDGHAEVMQTFKAGKNVIIAGCRITDGKLSRSSQARVLRKGEKVYEGKIGSLRRGKDDVREVATGFECGIVLDDFTAIEVGDIIEAFSQERVAPGA